MKWDQGWFGSNFQQSWDRLTDSRRIILSWFTRRLMRSLWLKKMRPLSLLRLPVSLILWLVSWIIYLESMRHAEVTTFSIFLPFTLRRWGRAVMLPCWRPQSPPKYQYYWHHLPWQLDWGGKVSPREEFKKTQITEQSTGIFGRSFLRSWSSRFLLSIWFGSTASSGFTIASAGSPLSPFDYPRDETQQQYQSFFPLDVESNRLTSVVNEKWPRQCEWKINGFISLATRIWFAIVAIEIFSREGAWG